MNYNFKQIEKKWQKYWYDNKLFKTDNDPNKPKKYILDMFHIQVHLDYTLDILVDILQRTF